MRSITALWSLLVINLVVYGLLLAVAYFGSPSFWTTVGVGVTGVVLGWVAGFLASPIGKPEGERFTSISGAIATFASGYLVSKLDPVVTALLVVPGRLATQAVAINVMVFISCFASGALIMYIVRQYLNETAIAARRA